MRSVRIISNKKVRDDGELFAIVVMVDFIAVAVVVVVCIHMFLPQRHHTAYKLFSYLLVDILCYIRRGMICLMYDVRDVRLCVCIALGDQ